MCVAYTLYVYAKKERKTAFDRNAKKRGFPIHTHTASDYIAMCRIPIRVQYSSSTTIIASNGYDDTDVVKLFICKMIKESRFQ